MVRASGVCGFELVAASAERARALAREATSLDELKAGLPARCGIESALMVYHYARWLGFDSAYFEVRRENVSVWRFHESFGARRVAVRDDHFQYVLDAQALDAALQRYRRYLPHGIAIDDPTLEPAGNPRLTSP